MIFIFFIDLVMLNCSVRAHIQSASSTGVLYEPWKYEGQPIMITPSSGHRNIADPEFHPEPQRQCMLYKPVVKGEPNQKIDVSQELEGVG